MASWGIEENTAEREVYLRCLAIEIPIWWIFFLRSGSRTMALCHSIMWRVAMCKVTLENI